MSLDMFGGKTSRSDEHSFSCVTSQQYLGNAVLVAATRMWNSSRRAVLSHYTSSPVRRNRAKMITCNINSINCREVCTEEKPQERSIATSSSTAILDCSSPVSNSITPPIRISTPNLVIFTATCDRDLSN